MPGLITLAIFLTSLAFFVGGYFLSSTFYFKKHDVKYSLKRMFPYEFNYPTTFKNNIYGNIAFIISLLGIMAFYIYYISTRAKPEVSLIVVTAMSVMNAVCISCLLFMPLQFLRLHMIISTLAMVLSFAMPAINCCYLYPLIKNATDNVDKTVYLIAFIIGAFFALAMLVLLLNPKATYKIYYDKVADENGNEQIVRPRFIPIAFNEWWAIITFLLSTIPLIIAAFR